MKKFLLAFYLLCSVFLGNVYAADPSNTNVTIICTDAGGARWISSPTHPCPVLATFSASSPVSIVPTISTFTDRSGTITTGGVSQTLMAANASRKSFLVQNPPTATENLYINFTSAASASTLALTPGASYFEESSVVTSEAVTVFAATTGHAFIAKEM